MLPLCGPYLVFVVGMQVDTALLGHDPVLRHRCTAPTQIDLVDDTGNQGSVILRGRIVAWYSQFVLGQDIGSCVVEEGADGFGEAKE